MGKHGGSVGEEWGRMRESGEKGGEWGRVEESGGVGCGVWEIVVERPH